MKNAPPSPLLEEALSYCQGNKAIDVGAGPLNDANFLVQKGFEVTALDNSPLMAEIAMEYPDITPIVSNFDTFDFPKNTYNLINSQWSLSFNPPDTFDAMFSNIKESLKPSGVFCFTLYGKNDEWAKSKKDMTFINSKSEVQSLLSGFDILKLEEEDADIKNKHNENTKHWHVYYVIAKKK